MKINTDNWKSFPIATLFNIKKGTRLTKYEMKPGNINYIGATAFSNGVTAKIGNVEKLHPAGTITVCYNGSIGQAFYQDEQYWATDDVNVLYPKFKISINIAHFIISVIRLSSYKYQYADKWTSEKMAESELLLPAKSDNQPDWDYMENYIISQRKRIKKSIEELCLCSLHNESNIDLKDFKRFHLYDEQLFVIDSGTKLDKVRMTTKNPSVNFVGRSNANNGVTDYIDVIDGIIPYKAGNLTVSLGGEYLGSCFIQKKEFYTSQNVNVLIPRHEMTMNCKQYIATTIFREGRLHYKAFIDELNKHMNRDFSIPLPIDNLGKIDWEYMDMYMCNLKNRVNRNLNHLLNIGG